ncbi:MAG: Inositol-1-monophosphatase (IMPase) (Inositol-1-phosphatase) (I-1-Pase) [Parcubacteria group bacterium Gr01-1014_31]|nr:MAG: Inositol-1-monophosphatase (IMPase) (Inositol-1-phosphatase) (I-1-Pase) [Parcubacteria group bacterium Gr01-1014_31]
MKKRSDKTLSVMMKAALAGGRVLRRYFGKAIAVETKSTTADFRTDADLGSEKAVIRILEKAFPKYNIVSEEMGERGKGSEFTFVLDPLDGTNNFVLGIPFFSVSMCLISDHVIRAAVVYDPMRKRLFTAVRGGGAYCNGKKIRVNQQADLRHATLAYIAPYGNTPEVECDFVRPFFAAGIKRMLTLWTPALDFCMLAEGKIEAILHSGSEFYDYAAGRLIAKEAGAKMTTFQGDVNHSDEHRQFIASNGTQVHDRLLEILKNR